MTECFVEIISSKQDRSMIIVCQIIMIIIHRSSILTIFHSFWFIVGWHEINIMTLHARTSIKSWAITARLFIKRIHLPSHPLPSNIAWVGLINKNKNNHNKVWNTTFRVATNTSHKTKNIVHMVWLMLPMGKLNKSCSKQQEWKRQYLADWTNKEGGKLSEIHLPLFHWISKIMNRQ